MNANRLVAFLQKPASEFTKADIISFIRQNDIKMVNFMYPAGDGRLKTLNFIITNEEYLDTILPFRKEWSGAAGKICLSLQRDGNKVTVHREIELTHPVISPEAYADLRALILLWQDDAYRTLILKDK